MAIYVTLYQFTDQGVKGVKNSPKRLQEGIKKFKKMGGRVLGSYYTQGAYDLVVISETNDEKVATAFTLATAALGNVRSTTMRAFTPTEFQEIVDMIP